jgi:hypothetical protein
LNRDRKGSPEPSLALPCVVDSLAQRAFFLGEELIDAKNKTFQTVIQSQRTSGSKLKDSPLGKLELMPSFFVEIERQPLGWQGPTISEHLKTVPRKLTARS